MDTLDTDQLKTVLGLANSRVKDVTDALERNWTIQLICTAVGIALVYDIADLPKIICKYFSQGYCTSQSVAPILIVVVLYYFMKFGQLLTAFLEARQLLDHLLDTYLGKCSEMGALKPIRESMSFFEGYYASTAFISWTPLRAAYFLVSPLVIAWGQAAALFLLVRAYKANTGSLLVVGVAIVALVIFYGGFWYSRKGRLHTTRIVFTCVALIPVAFILFWITAP
jgi:hypothetical protein